MPRRQKCPSDLAREQGAAKKRAEYREIVRATLKRLTDPTTERELADVLGVAATNIRNALTDLKRERADSIAVTMRYFEPPGKKPYHVRAYQWQAPAKEEKRAPATLWDAWK